MNFNLTLTLIFSALSLATTQAQVAGCMDPQAGNFNPSATSNDGSCTYVTTTLTTVQKTNLNDLLQETSGLQWADDHLWTFNDGGGPAAIYKIDTLTNSLLQTVTLENATNIDWEDIAFYGSHFYIGDFGNNANGARTDLKIYKFPVGAIPDHTVNNNVTIPQSSIQVIHFTYADQPQPPVATAPNATSYDCEAMIVDGGGIHLFTKDWISNSSTHYLINSTLAGTYTATPVETLATGYLVTGADKSPVQNIVTLLGYQASGTAMHYMHLLSDYNSGQYFNGNKRRLDLNNVLTMGQAEGICFKTDFAGYISNERFATTVGGFPINVPQRLRAFDISSFISNYVLPIHLLWFEAVASNGSHIVEWQFEKEVDNVQVQHSTDGLAFHTLSVLQGTKGKFIHQPTDAGNYYRLKWENEDGSFSYSPARFLKGNPGTRSKVSIHNNTLHFWLSENSQHLSLVIRTIDGRILANIPAARYAAGSHAIRIAQLPFASAVIVTMYQGAISTSSMVWVQ